jgi:transcriptional regulator with XRE-family HTH domain
VTKSVYTTRYDQFRNLLIDARKESGLTQVDLAKRLVRPQSFVSKFERGERRLDVIEFLDIADALGIDPHQFLAKVAAQPQQRRKKKSAG